MRVSTPILLLFIVIGGFARADVDVRVGAGANCSTSNIQTAINGASAANGVTNILIARNNIYNAQQLDINGRNVRLIGGFANCSQLLPDSTKTIINGAGGGANTVVTVRGTTGTVAFQNLEITGGDEVTTSPGRGGGFAIAGGPHALVAIDNVLIDGNQAGYGGGIYVDNEHSSTAADVFVLIGSNVSINGNHGAYGGGGIWCRNARVHMIGSGSFIIFNTTSTAPAIQGPGGGIRAQNCEMDIASAGTFGSVSLNTAGGPGGGISVTGERSIVKLYAQTPSRPASINGNTAYGVGGGIDIGSSATVTGWDLVIDGNRSYSGGGAVSIFDNDGGAFDPATFTMYGSLFEAPDDPAEGGTAVLCAAELACNRLSNNLSRAEAEQPAPGAAIRASAQGGEVPSVQGQVDISLQGTKLLSNAGESLVRQYVGVNGRAFVNLNGALITGNTVSGALLHNPEIGTGLFGSSVLRLRASTVAGNTIGGNEVVRSTIDVFLEHSILWQPGKRVATSVDGEGFRPSWIDYLLVNDLTGLPASTHHLQQEPRFENPSGDNYRLRSDSPALDFAPTQTLIQPDLGLFEADNRPRAIDLASIANEFGPQDLGAYERQFDCTEDTIFCSGFEL
jgi:hypothetical protein